MKRILKKIGYTFLIILLLAIVAVLVFVNFHPTFGSSPDEMMTTRMQKAPNFVDGKFTNLHTIKEDFSWSDYRKMFMKMMKGNPNRKPDRQLPMVQWTAEQVQALDDSITTAVWYGHSAFYIKMDGKHLLLDPMFGQTPSPVPYIMPGRFNDSSPIAIRDLPVIDVVVFSHDHYDHLDYGSIKKLKEKVKHFIVPLGVGAHLKRWGVASENITELYWGEDTEQAGIKFTSTPAQHFSGRGLGSKNSTLWSSWVIAGKKHKLYFSGDSGYFDGFKKIGDTYGPFDLCMVECGQYDVLWKDIHMMPEQTAQAHLDLRGKKLMPIHWGAFTLALHDWDDPILRLSRAAKEKNIDLVTPKIGEAVVVGQDQHFSEWWKF